MIDGFYAEKREVESKVNEYKKWIKCPLRDTQVMCGGIPRKVKFLSQESIKALMCSLREDEPMWKTLSLELEYKENYRDYLEYLDRMEEFEVCL